MFHVTFKFSDKMAADRDTRLTGSDGSKAKRQLQDVAFSHPAVASAKCCVLIIQKGLEAALLCTGKGKCPCSAILHSPEIDPNRGGDHRGFGRRGIPTHPARPAESWGSSACTVWLATPCGGTGVPAFVPPVSALPALRTWPPRPARHRSRA